MTERFGSFSAETLDERLRRTVDNGPPKKKLAPALREPVVVIDWI